MFSAVYFNPVAKGEEDKAKYVVEQLYRHYLHHVEELPEELKSKIEENPGTKVTIPEFGQTFELGAEMPVELERNKEVVAFDKELLRLNVLDKIEQMKDEISELANTVKEENFVAQDDDIKKLNDKIQEIQNQIKKMMK